MKPFRDLCVCLALLALAAALASVPLNIGLPKYAVNQLSEKLDRAIAREGERTRTAALVAIGESRADVLAAVHTELLAARVEASAHLVGITGVLDRRAQSLQSDLNTHGLILEQIAAHELGRAGDQVEQIGTEAQATLAESRRTVHDLHPQLLGLVAAGKVTSGEAAQTLRVIRDATPSTVRDVQSTVKHVDEISFRVANPFRPIGAGFKWIGRKFKKIF